ncbi:MAG: DNA-processing protein DprA [Anaerolineae bacterium]
MTSDLRYWVGFNRTKGIGPVRLRALIDHFGSIEAAWKASDAALRAAHILDQRTIQSLLTTRSSTDLDVELSRLAIANVTVITLADAGYPVALRQIPDPPPLLYVRGELPDDDALILAVVGTRRATSYGKQMTQNIVRELVARKVVIISGVARGVDVVALQTVLNQGGRCICVLPCGLDQIPTKETRKLAQAIAQEGAVVTEFPLGVGADRTHYHPRNRIISGLSAGVLVVEAGERSGALITADHALEQGRDVFAVPGNAVSATSVGTNLLIQAGAKVTLSADDIVDELRPPTATSLQSGLTQRRSSVDGSSMIRRSLVPQMPATETSEEGKIVAALAGAESLHIDEIAIAVDMPMAKVSATLSILTIRGVVQETGIQQYVLIS